MIRQFCPHCYQPAELPDAAAGRDAPCPHCGKPISVPAAYAPTVAAGGGLSPVPPPPPLPPIHPPTTGASPMTEPTPPPGMTPPASGPIPPPGYLPPSATGSPPTPPPTVSAHKLFGFALDPAWLDWVPVVALWAAVVLSFFTWAEIRLGGHALFTQSAWDTLGARVNTSALGGEWEATETAIKARVRSNWLMLPFLVLCLPTALLATAERLLPRVDATRLPGPLGAFAPKLIPRLLLILCGLTLLMLVFTAAQSFLGYGLDAAVREEAADRYKEQRTAATTDAAVKAAEVRIGQEQAKLPVTHTIFQDVALFALVLAALALLAREWLVARGPARPKPWIGLEA